ncbi:glycoside hydrolase family 99-like domain-containing protein, partial [Dubosiella newyorkensis]
MNDIIKIIAYYLPQFHTFKENDEWWGKGFTEWRSVKNAKPLYKQHNQPRVPLNDNYYDLTDKKALKWQADLAKKYGIYGFCYYHY